MIMSQSFSLTGSLRTLCVCAALLPSLCRADFVLLQNGDGLFNVTVEDTLSTQSRPLKIRYRPMSFAYEYSRDTVHALLGHRDSLDVADYYSTSTEVGKSAARQWMAARHWEHYTPPPREILKAFTPAPKIIYTPPPQNTPPPDNIADQELPLNQRIQAQLDIFINEQQTLGDRIKAGVQQKQMDEQQGKVQRLKLLEYQQKILANYFPESEDLVGKAKEALKQQAKNVEQKGHFNFEY